MPVILVTGPTVAQSLLFLHTMQHLKPRIWQVLHLATLATFTLQNKCSVCKINWQVQTQVIIPRISINCTVSLPLWQCSRHHTDRLKPKPIELHTALAFVQVNQPPSTKLVALVFPHRLYAFLQNTSHMLHCRKEHSHNSYAHSTAVFYTTQHPFNSLFSRTTWVSRQQKGKPFWILIKQEMMGRQSHEIDHMQIICTSPSQYWHSSFRFK